MERPVIESTRCHNVGGSRSSQSDSRFRDSPDTHRPTVLAPTISLIRSRTSPAMESPEERINSDSSDQSNSSDHERPSAHRPIPRASISLQISSSE
ncbi:hypothetical protein R1flu_003355 [Riccia fluitans]|uniref:Uncharacterized protein n=1 Tax=Riccia fluitans TaxID=41844 RepID=A0ABD1Y9C0_9MARC